MQLPTVLYSEPGNVDTKVDWHIEIETIYLNEHMLILLRF